MASYLQQVLSMIMMTPNASSTAEPHININPVALSPSTALPPPTTISNILAFLFSLSALRDWVKLIVLGGFFETCRRIVFGMYSKLISSFWMNAYFEDQDPCYSMSPRNLMVITPGVILVLILTFVSFVICRLVDGLAFEATLLE